MGTDVDSFQASPRCERDGDRDSETSDVTDPMLVIIEHDRTVGPGQLVGLGLRRARVRTSQRLRNGEPLVLTVSVPETCAEKTQALFRLSSRVRRRRHDRASDYVLLFSTDEDNLDRASELYARFRARGIVEV